MIDPSIFKAYDVRGIYPDQMDEELAYRIGRGFARVLSALQDTPVPELSVAVGHDMRLSAPAMAERYAAGIADEGADVLDIGMAATEMVYWTVGSRELDGGLVCTASHNPKAYTGAKLVKRGAKLLRPIEGVRWKELGRTRAIAKVGIDPQYCFAVEPAVLEDRPNDAVRDARLRCESFARLLGDGLTGVRIDRPADAGDKHEWSATNGGTTICCRSPTSRGSRSSCRCPPCSTTTPAPAAWQHVVYRLGNEVIIDSKDKRSDH